MPATRRFVQTIAGQMRLHPFYLLVAFGSTCCLLVVAATIWMLWAQYSTTIRVAGSDLQNLSRAVADQTDRVIESVELAEDRLLDHMAVDQDGALGEPLSMTGNRQLHIVMRDIIAGMSRAYALIMVDASGNLVNFSYDFPIPPRSLADRSFFLFARDHPEVKSFISETVTNRQTGRPTFYVIRRLTGPDGAFKGVLMGAVQADYLERLFGVSTLAKGGSVTLFRADGTILVRRPVASPQSTEGHEAEARAAFSGADHGAIRHAGVLDGVDRLTVISSLPGYPLKVAVSVPFSTVIAAWQVEAAWIGGIAALGCLTMGITILSAIRRFHAQQRLEAATLALKVDGARAGAEREIAEQHARFGMALDNMSQALLMFDRSNLLLLSNVAVLRIFGLQPGTLQLGMTFMDVIHALDRIGDLSQHATTVIEHYKQLVHRNIPAKFLLKAPAGRYLTAIFVPHDSGWLMTFEDVTEVYKADQRIMHMAMHDTLTGLPNRAMFKTRTDEALAAIHNGGGGFAVMCLDLDNFKDVNDTMGHPAGDRLLCEVAERIQSVIRRSDVVVRLGGDEFAIVAYPVDEDAGIARLAARLVEVIGGPYDINGQMAFVGASIGIAMAPADGTTPETLMKSADLALYRAKNDGRGRYAFFEPAMEQHLADRRRVEIELRNALMLDELELFYQPIVKVAGRRVIGFEALMRWRHPIRGMIPPGEFIAVAEENGFIIPIGEWALNRACQEASRWPGALRVAVNLSSLQFRGGNLVETVAAALKATGLLANRLELEITESTMMQDTDTTLAIINEIKALGVRIVMDDFGTGYSSLAYLQRFPFDKVKIDRAFVRDSGQTTNLAIIRAVTSIARNMGIETTAEGVETEEQFARVAAEGCDEAQGYLFSKPRPGSEVAAMIAEVNPPAAPVRQRTADMAAV